MKIKKITSQHRRDFTAILECGHCGNEDDLKYGYDDDFYHRNVIPNINCSNCGKSAGEDCRPLTTKYEAGQTV
jgi:transcription elongation factor Elf1